MTPCTYQIDHIFERYFPQYWRDRMCFRVDRWDDMTLGTRSGLLCHLIVNRYRSIDDVSFDFSLRPVTGGDYVMSDNVHIFLIGPQASGKTTLANELEHRGWERIISYTTRPQRPGEENDVDYHFVTDREFEDAFLDGELTCVRSYATVHGLWKYGFAWSDLNRAVDSVAVIDPEGYLQIHDQIEHCFGIYLDIPDDVRIARLMIRGDDPAELNRRFEADKLDFATLDECYQDVCSLRITNVRTVESDVDRIEMYIRKYRREHM